MQYLAEYLRGFYNGGGPRTIGVEKEFPVVQSKNFLAFDVRQIFPDLLKAGTRQCLAPAPSPFFDDYYKDVIQGVRMSDGTVVTTDAGWGLLEIALPPVKSIQEAEGLFNKHLSLIKEQVEKRGGRILGYGIQPLQQPNESNWVRRRRHEAVFRTFCCPRHDAPITITASDQCHISIASDEVAPATNLFNWMAGIIIALFANSPIWKGEKDKAFLAAREAMWWFTQHNRHGVFSEPVKDASDLLKRILSLRQLIALNGKDYFTPHLSFETFLQENPSRQFLEELKIMEGTMWYCARPRSGYGTIEVRPACCQPRESAMALSAFCLGICQKIREAQTLIDSFCWPWSAAHELREVAMRDGLAGEAGGRKLRDMAEQFLELGISGLEEIGRGEEKYLEPLCQRVKSGKTLAEEIVNLFDEGGLPALVERVAY